MNKKNCNTIEKYKKSCGNVIKTFEEKHDYQFNYWVGDEIGGIAVFNEQYYFNLNDIIYDIENDVEKGSIFEWHDYIVENLMNNKYNYSINFKNYLKGCRYV